MFGKRKTIEPDVLCTPFTIGTTVVSRATNRAGKITAIGVNEYGIVERVDVESIEKNANGVNIFSAYNQPFLNFIKEYIW